MKYKYIVIILIFCFSLFIRLATLNQIGRTWDEPQFIEEGYRMVELFKAGDLNNSFFYTTYDHPPLIKYIFGITSYLDIKETKPNGDVIFNYDYTYSRILSATLFSIGVVMTVLLGWRLFSPFVGGISGVILAMLPFSVGLSQLISAESLKIFIYPIAIYSILLLVEKFSLKRAIVVGLIIGIALQVKQSNGLLFLVLVGMLIIRYFSLGKKKRLGYIKSRIAGFFVVVVGSMLSFIALWPQAIFNLDKIYKIHDKFWGVEFSPKPWLITMSVPEVFFGRLIITPNFYYLVYFFISTPVVILALFFVGIWKIVMSKNWKLYILIIWFCVPFLLSLYSWRQHGLRYLIEIYPALALISAIGFDSLASRLTTSLRNKALIFGLVIIYLFASLLYVKPYYLEYYNELVGGTGNVYRNNWFQIGWWGQGLREAGLYIINNSENDSEIGLAISPDHVLPRSENLIYSDFVESKNYDYVIVNHYHIIRDGFDDSSIRADYNLIYQVKADGATLVYIYKK